MGSEFPEGPVTVMFTDVEGSTDMAATKGDQISRAILQIHERLVRDQVGEHGGRIVRSTGDGLMAAFGSTRKAVSCAVAIQRATDRHSRRDPQHAFRLRIGMNTGEVVEGEEELFGAAVHAAARIAAKARGGEVLISEVVRQLAGTVPDVSFVDRGRFRLKGFPDRWKLFEIAWDEDGEKSLPSLAERTPFVGRSNERFELVALLERALSGRGTIAMIGGDPGIGKTRLVEELAQETRRLGGRVLMGRCYEMGHKPPYIPFVEIMEGALDQAEDPKLFRQVLGPDSAEIARIVPRLRRHFDDIPSPLELPPEQERYYLQTSVRAFLERAAAVRPMLLVLDDIHWADESTLMLLEHLALHLSEMPVLIAATHRQVDPGSAEPLNRTLAELLRQRLAHQVALRPLDEMEIHGMIRALMNQDPPASLVGDIYKETEGNPFFVEEILKHLLEENRLFDPNGRLVAELRVTEHHVPERVRLVIGHRLGRLAESTHRVLEGAAVVGRAFSYGLLEALGDLDGDHLIDAIDEAERAQLIVAGEGSQDLFTFAHELIRQTLLAGMSSARRRKLHARAAEAIEKTHAASLEGHSQELAHHLMEAGPLADISKLVRYLELAGERALEVAAFEDALRYFDLATDLPIEEVSSVRAGLLFRRGLALRSLGEFDEALDVWRRALSVYEELGQSEQVARLCGEIGIQLGWGGRPAEAAEFAWRGLTAAGTAQTADRGLLLAGVAVATSFLGDHRGASDMLDEGVDLVQRHGDDRIMGQVLYWKTLHHWFSFEADEAVTVGSRARELLSSTGAVWDLANLLYVLQFSLMQSGRFDEAKQVGAELESLSQMIGHVVAHVMSNRRSSAVELAETGDVAAFEKWALEDLEICRTSNVAWISHAYLHLGLVNFWRGDWTEAQRNFEEAAALEVPGAQAGWDWSYLFLFKAYSGDAQSVRQMYEERKALLADEAEKLNQGKTMLLGAFVEGLYMVGEGAEAGTYYPRILSAMETGNMFRVSDLRLLETLAGIAAAGARRWSDAERHFERALRLAAELPVLIEGAEARRFYAQMLVDRGEDRDIENATGLVNQAIAIYDEVGMPSHRAFTQEILTKQ